VKFTPNYMPDGGKLEAIEQGVVLSDETLDRIDAIVRRADCGAGGFRGSLKKREAPAQDEEVLSAREARLNLRENR